MFMYMLKLGLQYHYLQFVGNFYPQIEPPTPDSL